MNTTTSRLLSGLTLTALATGLLMGCNRAPEDTPGGPAPSVSVGTQVDDATITAGVKAALLTDPNVKSFDLQVETRKGTVQLSGFVDNQSQIDQALAITRSVAGVTAVENSVTVKAAPTAMGTKVDDATVTGRVKSAFLADADIKSFDISVVTFNGEVQLTGFVNSQGQIERAAEIARATEGASSVKNELKVKQ